MSTPGQSPSAVSSPAAAGSSRFGAGAGSSKPQPRVLSCVSCQQRKVKCDRRFPCANCVKSGTQCVPAALLQRQRRRRFPERELLDRLRHYETLLRRNNISFEPLHGSTSGTKASTGDGAEDVGSPDEESSRGFASMQDGQVGEMVSIKSPQAHEPKNFWNAMNQRSRHSKDYNYANDEDDGENDDDDFDDTDSAPDDINEHTVKKAYDQLFESSDDLLFGSRKASVDLSTLHPGQAQIFKLWQIYLDNVNPLLKVTHTPTLQTRIIDAASNLADISPPLEALMFGIYCLSTSSLTDDECYSLFGSYKRDVLKNYQFGCYQALLNCELLRTSDRDCLTAFYFYLTSIRFITDPRSLFSMLGVAMRIAQTMGIHRESANAKRTVLEAEMCRRLWWSLVIFEARIGEVADQQSVTLAPTWDCRIPLNVNDFDLRPEMKSLPVATGGSSEAVFAIVRSEIADYSRHNPAWLDFFNPALKCLVKAPQDGPSFESSELVAVEKMIEEKYLKACNPEIPLHYITIWMARGFLAKSHLVEFFSWSSRAPVQPTDAERDSVNIQAMRMIECDTKLLTSPLSKGYLWHAQFYFPFPAYVHLLQDLRKRPVGKHAWKAWETLSDNFAIRINDVISINESYSGDNPLFKSMCRFILQSWAAREAISDRVGAPEALPRMVADIRQKAEQRASGTQDGGNAVEQSEETGSLSSDDFAMPMPMGFGDPGMMYGIGGQGVPPMPPAPPGLGPGPFPRMPGQGAMDVDMTQLNWTAANLHPLFRRAW